MLRSCSWKECFRLTVPKANKKVLRFCILSVYDAESRDAYLFILLAIVPSCTASQPHDSCLSSFPESMCSNKKWLLIEVYREVFSGQSPWWHHGETVEKATANTCCLMAFPSTSHSCAHPPLNIKENPGLLPLCLCLRRCQLYLRREWGGDRMHMWGISPPWGCVCEPQWMFLVFFFFKVCENMCKCAPQVVRENKSSAWAPHQTPLQPRWNMPEPLLGSQNLGASSQQAPQRMEGCCELAR